MDTRNLSLGSRWLVAAGLSIIVALSGCGDPGTNVGDEKKKDKPLIPPSVSQRAESTAQGAILGTVIGAQVGGSVGAAVGAAVFGLYGLVTGDAPLSDGKGSPRHPT